MEQRIRSIFVTPSLTLALTHARAIDDEHEIAKDQQKDKIGDVFDMALRSDRLKNMAAKAATAARMKHKSNILSERKEELNKGEESIAQAEQTDSMPVSISQKLSPMSSPLENSNEMSFSPAPQDETDSDASDNKV